MQRRNATVGGRALFALVLIATLSLPVAVEGQSYTFTHFVGPDGGPDWVDATGTNARFHYPSGVVQDAAGNLYVSDGGNHCIRRITPAGVVTTFAGKCGEAGFVEGGGGEARFSSPRQIAIDPSNNLYVADMGNSLIRKITPAGVVTRFAGTAYMSGTVNGDALSAQFNWPKGIAINPSGDIIYVSDSMSHVIRKITGGVVTTFAGVPGETGATATPARFNQPSGLAVDPSGNLFVADSRNYTIRRITPAGSVATFAGSPGVPGTTDGTGLDARFLQPEGVATDPSGNVFVADSYHTIRRITPAAVVSTFAGGNRGAVDGVGTAAAFLSPQAITFGTDGNLYVAEVNGHVIRKITPAALVSTFAGKAAPDDIAVDGAGAAARFRQPYGLEVDGSGNLYVADRYGFSIRKVTPAGTVSTFAGDGVSGTGDGASGRFDNPIGLTIDGSGNVYVAEFFKHTIRKVTPAGVISTIAGSAGMSGSANGAGTTARFDNPFDLAVDSLGNVYVTDQANHTIRKITFTPAASVSTFAGTAGLSGSSNGTGSAARFNRPTGIVRDASNNLYVADQNNRTIRKITPAGVVTTFAGATGVAGSDDGTGTSARFNDLRSLTIDSSGNLYALDYNRVRRITPGAVVTTLAGGGASSTREGTGSLAGFHNPNAIAVSPDGTLYVSSNDSHQISSGRPALSTVATIDLPSGPAHVTRQLAASPAAASTYAWSIVRRPSGSTANLSSTTAANPTFTPDEADSWVFRLEANHATNGRSITHVELAGECSPITIGPASVPDGMAGATYSVTFSASGGTPPYHFSPAAGYLPPGFTLTSAGVFSGTPAADTYGTSIRVTDATGCSADRSIAFRIYPYPAPTGLVANGGNGAVVFLTWNAVPGGAAGYRVYRRSASTWFTLIAETPDTWVSDFSSAENAAYYYYVVARDGSGEESQESNTDLATTVAFTDGSLSGVTVKAAHVLQIRTALNAFAALIGIGAYAYEDPALAGVAVKAIHLTQMRQQLNFLRSYPGLGPVSFTDSDPEGVAIKRVHINELRAALR